MTTNTITLIAMFLLYRYGNFHAFSCIELDWLYSLSNSLVQVLMFESMDFPVELVPYSKLNLRLLYEQLSVKYSFSGRTFSYVIQ